MPNLRNQADKRKSDSFVIDHDKAIKKLAIEKKRKGQETLSAQVKSLKEANDILIKENSEKIIVIESLKEQLEELKLKSSQKQPMDDSKRDFNCKNCQHTLENQDNPPLPMETEQRKNPYKCNLCCETFEVKWQMMVHRKNKHSSSLISCKYLMRGFCAFGNDCWFNHTQINRDSKSPTILKEFKCGLCDKVHTTKKEFMEHRKDEHASNVADCMDNKHGHCRFGSEKCWYKHENENKNIKNDIRVDENSDIIQRLFKMMETFAERMALVEKQK